MFEKVNQWIDAELSKVSEIKIPCSRFDTDFSGFFEPEFLSRCYFVVVDQIPMPDDPGFRETGLGDFLEMEIEGITYKDTYFIKRGNEHVLKLHFHELVHAVQWRFLGAEGFINRYISEIQNVGYDDAPLEKMAYELERYYDQNGKPVDIVSTVTKNL